MIADGHKLYEILEYDFRQIIYFVKASKTLHNSRQIEQYNLHAALRGGEKAVKEYLDSLD